MACSTSNRLEARLRICVLGPRDPDPSHEVYIGFDVQHSINYPNSSEIGFHIGHYIFTLAFIVELAIRLAAQGWRACTQ